MSTEMLQTVLDLLNQSTIDKVTHIYVTAMKLEPQEPPKLMMLKHTVVHLMDSKWEVIFGLLKETDTPIGNIDKLFKEHRQFKCFIEEEFDTLIERSIALEGMNDLML